MRIKIRGFKEQGGRCRFISKLQRLTSEANVWLVRRKGGKRGQVENVPGKTVEEQ